MLPDDQKQAQGPVTKAGAANHITAALKQLGGQAAMKSDPWADIKTGPLRIKPHKAQNTAVQVDVSRCLSEGQQGLEPLQHACRCSARLLFVEAGAQGATGAQSGWSATHRCAASMRTPHAADYSQRRSGYCN